MRTQAGAKRISDLDTKLWDVVADPQQTAQLKDEGVEAMMTEHLVRLMKENDAPLSQYERLGLSTGAGESD